MTTILERQVSLFAHAKATVPTGKVPLSEILGQIKDGTSARLIAELRKAKPHLSEDEYRAKKAKLRCFTPCCTVRTRDHKIAVDEKLTSVVEIVHLDFDHVTDLQGTRENLLTEPALVFCFVSPGGDGLKVGFAATGIVSDTTYKHAWNTLVAYLEARYPGLAASRDNNVSFITALCYVSHDPDLFMRDDAVPITVPPYEQPEPTTTEPQEPREGPSAAVVSSALFCLRCYDDYKLWVQVGQALHSTGEPWAFSLWDAWSRQSPKYKPQEPEAKWQGFDRDGNVKIDTLFGRARKAGWQDPGITSYLTTNYLAENYPGFDKDSCGEEAPQANTSFTSSILLKEWPALGKEAFHGLAGEIVRTIAPHTEADPVSLLIQLLTYFGVVIGRSAYHWVGRTYHYTNLSVCLVGATSRSRKGSAYDYIEACFLPVDPASFTWSHDNIIGGCGSGEGVIAAVRDPVYKRERVKDAGDKTPRYEEVEADPGVADKRLLIYEAEFSSVLKVASRENNLLSEVLRKAWETGYLRNTTKTAPLKATGAHIALIGHTTIDELQKTLTATEAANGFANRILWLCVKRHGSLPEGGSLEEPVLEGLRDKLRSVVKSAQSVQRMGRDEAAKAAWKVVFDHLTEDRPGLAGSLIARAEGQVLRLSLLYALLDSSATIGHQHLNAALALWQYVEHSVWYLFGTTLGDVAADTVLADLDQAKDKSLSRNHLLTKTLHSNYRADELDRVLRLLQRLELVTITQKPTGKPGRPAEIIKRTLNEVNEVNTPDYVSISNDAVKTWQLSHEVIMDKLRGNSQNGPEVPPFVPDMTGYTPDSTPSVVPDNGNNIPDEVPMREPGDEDDFETGEI